MFKVFADDEEEIKDTKKDQKFQKAYNTKRIYEPDKHKTKLVVSVIDDGIGIKKKKQ